MAPGQQVLPWGGRPELPLPLQWQQLVETPRRANGARARVWEAPLWCNRLNRLGAWRQSEINQRLE
jgi:hypothetical protein